MDGRSAWRQRAVFAIGGLTEIGFVPGSSLLLVVSHQGRGLFDCESGERVARDDEDPTGSWFDAARPAALGIGEVIGTCIPVVGLAGGRPIDRTDDGWHATSGKQSVTLAGPGESQTIPVTATEVRAFSFSQDGQFLALGTPSDLTIYARSPRELLTTRRALVRYRTAQEGGRTTAPQSRVRSQLEIDNVMTSCTLSWDEDTPLRLGQEIEMTVELLFPERFQATFPNLRVARFFEGAKLVGEGRFLSG